MQQHPVWLITSLFTSKDHWNEVLCDGIAPFLAHNTINKLVNGYDITFNYDGGDNIRLALQTNKVHAEELARSADDHFKQFFQHKNYPTPEPGFFNGVFMPFPVNTIQYGLYEMEGIDNREHRFRKVLSKLILIELSTEVIDEAQLLLFAFDLQLIYIKKLITTTFIPDLTALYRQYLTKKEVSITPEMLSEAYEENKEVLWEMAAADSSFEEWQHACKDDITASINSNATFLQTFHCITRQLALTDNMAAMLLYFITQAAAALAPRA